MKRWTDVDNRWLLAVIVVTVCTLLVGSRMIAKGQATQFILSPGEAIEIVAATCPPCSPLPTSTPRGTLESQVHLPQVPSNLRSHRDER